MSQIGSSYSESTADTQQSQTLALTANTLTFPKVWRFPMTQSATPPTASALYEKIAKISAKLEEATPKFNGAVAIAHPARNTEPTGRHDKPWGRGDS